MPASNVAKFYQRNKIEYKYNYINYRESTGKKIKKLILITLIVNLNKNFAICHMTTINIKK